MRASYRFLSLAAAVAAVSSGALAAAPESWSFGVIADTQWLSGQPASMGVNSVATSVINQLNQQLVARKVDFALQVGDLTDNGSLAGLQSRLDANSSLNGIPFYALRGNHESSSADATFFQQNYIPSSNAAATIAVAPDNTSYSVTYKNTKLVLLDIAMAGNVTVGSPASLDNLTTWTGQQLSLTDHNQAFVFSHKNLLGQNHKDNVFGSSNDANPTQQNNFISTLQNGGVKYYFSGHDHMHHRSVVTSPDGGSSVQQIICASDSSKFYTPTTPYSTREQVLAQQYADNPVGFYIVRMNGPMVSTEYWATSTSGTWTTAEQDLWNNGTPGFQLRETFGYSTNGTNQIVGRGGSYKGIGHTIAAGDGYTGTSVSILDGINTNTADVSGGRQAVDQVSIGWIARESDSRQVGDTVRLWGMQNALGDAATDKYVVSLSYDPSLVGANGEYLHVEWRDTMAPGTDFTTFSSLPAQGAYADGSYASLPVGTWGINSADNTVWAITDRQGDFVAAVPEPTSLMMLGIPAVLILRRQARSKRA